MPSLVSPDGVLYVINDTDSGQDDLKALAALRSDLPPPKNLNQLLGWTAGPHGQPRTVAANWQLLEDLKWAERDGVYIPLIGSATNALNIFNKHCKTSHIMNGSFRNLMSGYRPFDGWNKSEHAPWGIHGLASGSSLVGLRSVSPLLSGGAEDAEMPNATFGRRDIVGAAAPLARMGASSGG